MSLSFTKLNSYQEWDVDGVTEPVTIGDHVSNNTQAGEGTIVSISRASFGTGALESVKFLVISGAFADNDNLTADSGGDFDLNGSATVTTVETILVSGTMAESDTTTNTSEAIDLTETTIDINDYSNISPLTYLKIDSEYMIVDKSVDSATDYMNVVRGALGSTIATHTTAADVYQIDDYDLFEQILDEDVAQGWGLSTTSNGRIELNCSIMLGRSDQTSASRLVSKLENVDVTYDIYVVGNSSYGTELSIGVGQLNSDNTGMYINGSIIRCNNFYNFANTQTRLYAAKVFIDGGDFMSFGALEAAYTSFEDIDCNNNMSFMNTETCCLYKCLINNQRVNAASTSLDWEDLYINYISSKQSIYFISGVGNATFENIYHLNPTFDGGAYAFAAGGSKYFNDCKLNTSFGRFLANVSVYHRKYISVYVQKRDRTAIEGATVTVRYIDGTLVGTDTTDSNGEAEVLTQFYQAGTIGASTTREIEVFVRKAGYKTVYYRDYIDNTDDPLLIPIYLEYINIIDK